MARGETISLGHEMMLKAEQEGYRSSRFLLLLGTELA
jgi:hypothetical protein